MRKKKDTVSNLILLLILSIIIVLIFYMFFYSRFKQHAELKKSEQDQNSPSLLIPSSLPKTKYEGKSVYIIEPRVKIRQEPRPDSTVLAENTKGDKVTVTNAWGDWFEVLLDSGKKGWLLRDQVSNRRPSLPKVEKTPVTPNAENQEKNIAIDQVRAEIYNIIEPLNQLAQQQFLKKMVEGFEVLEEGSKLTIYLSDAWYYIPQYQKQLMCNAIAMQYGRLTCQYKIRSECSANDFPTISYLNQNNKEIARIAANQPLQIFE